MLHQQTAQVFLILVCLLMMIKHISTYVIASILYTTQSWANRTRGLDNITLLLKPDNIFVIGNQGPNNIQTYFLSTVIGVKSKIIFGYKDIIKALEMNEIDARFGTIMSAESRYPQWLTGQDVIVPILQMGAPHRHPSIKMFQILESLSKMIMI